MKKGKVTKDPWVCVRRNVRMSSHVCVWRVWGLGEACTSSRCTRLVRAPHLRNGTQGGSRLRPNNRPQRNHNTGTAGNSRLSAIGQVKLVTNLRVTTKGGGGGRS
jgi:hypothetical protein